MKKTSPPKPWPRLSQTLPQGQHPMHCQACGADGRGGLKLTRWQEADEDDVFPPAAPVVVLCVPCADRLIEPHPRLYRQLERHEPLPGCMPLCVDCAHRDGNRCTHPDAKANGGPGVMLTMPKPSACFWDGRDKSGRRTGGMKTLYPGPVVSCRARRESTAAPAAPAPANP